jgi:hypothetical protein
MKIFLTAFIYFVSINVWSSDIEKSDKDKLEEYLSERSKDLSESPYSQTSGFFKILIDLNSTNIKYPNISYSGDDSNDIETFRKMMPNYMSKYINGTVKEQILLMMDREKKNSHLISLYHATANQNAIIIEVYTELYRAFKILPLKDKEQKILRLGKAIFSRFDDVLQVQREFQKDTNPEFSKRCLSCVPYVFGFYTSDTPPIGLWLSNSSYQVNLNFIKKIKEMYRLFLMDKIVEIKLKNHTFEEYITQTYQKILQDHKVDEWGGVMMQIFIPPNDLVKLGTYGFAPKYAYMCDIFGTTWAARAMASGDYRELNEIGYNVLNCVLNARQGKKQNYLYLHQLRYMPKNNPQEVRFYYANEHDEEKIEAFRKAIYQQIRKDLGEANINLLR